MRANVLLAALLIAVSATRESHAVVHVGDSAPNFRKAQLAAGPSVGAQVSLTDYAGKVVVLAIIGYS